MSRTKRKNWKGETVRDGTYCKRCPEYKCEICRKVWYRKLVDRLLKKEMREHE